MTRNCISIAFVLLSTACSDYIADLGHRLGSASGEQQGGDSEPDPDGEPVIVLQTVCDPSASDGFFTACLFDSVGHTYAIDSPEVPILPVQPPYGFSFLIDQGPTLTEADLTTEGEDAAIKAYVGTLSVEACGGLPEHDEANRVPTRAVASKQGGLTVLVDQALAPGTHLSFQLAFGPLLRNHFPLTNDGICVSPTDCDASGYSARLYVGEEPTLGAAAAATWDCGKKK